MGHRLNNPFRLLLALIALLVATEQQARAYTDPGSGALIWQTLAAGAVGLLFQFRRFLFHLIGKSRRSQDSQL